ncbi:YopX family protein [Listeria booriae]|nr:YopX family protein [Listeria booriae]
MRPIKFRAWDEAEKRWLNIDEFFIFYDGTIFLVTWLDDSVYDDAVTLGRAGENIKLVQYTGLKDKNGKKVFEGDILRVTEMSEGYKSAELEVKEFKAPVVFDDYGWILYDKEDTGYPLVILDRTFDSIGTDTEIEILGNLYDSPELLEVGAQK